MQESKWSWVSILIGAVIFVLYFVSRLFHLTLLPMFVDEGIHITWAIQMAQEGQFLSIINTGRIFPIWVMSLVMPFAGNNLLWAARLVSVGFGMFGLLGCYLLGKKLFDRRVGFLADVLYLVVPYTFFYDRMALVDSLLAASAVYIVLFSLALIREPGLKYSLGLGAVLVLAIMTKSNGFMLSVLPLVVIATQLARPIRDLPWKSLFLAYSVGALGLSSLLLISFSYYWGRISARMWLGRHIDTIPWLAWLLNGRDALLYMAQNLSLLIFIVACLGVGLAIMRRHRDELLLLGAASVTIAVFVFLGAVGRWYPRYLLPAVPFLLLIVARTITIVTGKLSQYLLKEQACHWSYAISYGLVLIIILPALWFDYWLVVDPSRAPFVEIDHWQYVRGTPAGYGLPETADFLRAQLSQAERIMVIYDEHPSTLPRVLQIYLYNQREHITHMEFGFWRVEDPDYLGQHLISHSVPVFLVISDPPDAGLHFDFDTWPYVQRVARFERPGGLSSVNIYQGVKQLP